MADSWDDRALEDDIDEHQEQEFIEQRSQPAVSDNDPIVNLKLLREEVKDMKSAMREMKQDIRKLLIYQDNTNTRLREIKALLTTLSLMSK